MCGVTSHGMRAIGHTGGGPGSVIAVYRLPDAVRPYTAADSPSATTRRRSRKE